MEKNTIDASSLIYGRTCHRDYDSNFLVKPNDFSAEDTAWARKYVLEASSYCDELKGFRHVIFSNEKFLVFGVTGILNSLLTHSLPEKEITQYQQYTFDENGRNIKCFLGFVCHMEKKSKGDLYRASERDFLEPFLNHVAKEDVWYSYETVAQGCEYHYSLECSKFQPNEPLPTEHVIISQKEDDTRLFEQILANSCRTANKSLCSNIYNLKMAKSDVFNYVTAGEVVQKKYQNSIQSCENNKKFPKGEDHGQMPSPSEHKKAENKKPQMTYSSKEHTRNETEVYKVGGNKKKGSILILTGITIIAVILLLTIIKLTIHGKTEVQEMSSIYDVFYKEGNLNSGQSSLDGLFECQEKYGRLLREYKPEIEYIETCLKELRTEETSFYEKELPQIIEVLKNDDVNEEARKIWLKKLQENMEKSFSMSRSLLQDFAIKQMDDFKEEAEKILRSGSLI